MDQQGRQVGCMCQGRWGAWTHQEVDGEVADQEKGADEKGAERGQDEDANVPGVGGRGGGEGGNNVHMRRYTYSAQGRARATQPGAGLRL